MLKAYKKLNEEIEEWVRFSTESDNSWHLKNMHIDQFSLFSNVKRTSWLKTSFELFNFIDNRVFKYHPLKLCLHIELTFAETNIPVNCINFKDLNENLHELTPPSLMFIKQEYLLEHYVELFNNVDISKDIQGIIETTSPVETYYRTFYDEEEELYLREIYVIK